ncbi:MAG: hypothetical protein ACPIOQ_49250, partial [Promethearchaeia archaeon]
MSERNRLSRAENRDEKGFAGIGVEAAAACALDRHTRATRSQQQSPRLPGKWRSPRASPPLPLPLLPLVRSNRPRRPSQQPSQQQTSSQQPSQHQPSSHQPSQQRPQQQPS